ncbi:hypothetical protein ABEB36_002403 [Hypothenemus hampei]|uniref:Uncharacterized protein n=1 Tax=Hypothenemus hampei TaxID=57062 RepID=A0ABD1F7A8_HYPHA
MNYLEARLVYAGIQNLWLAVVYFAFLNFQILFHNMQLTFMIIVVLEIGNKVIETRKYLKSRPEDIDSHKKSFSIVYEGIEIFGELCGYQFLTITCDLIINILGLLMLLIEMVKPQGNLIPEFHNEMVAIMGIILTFLSVSISRTA